MAKNDRPTISNKDLTRLMVTTYGASQVVRYYNAELKRQLTRANMFIAEDKPLPAIQGLSKMTEICDQIAIVLGDYDNIDDIEKTAKSRI